MSFHSSRSNKTLATIAGTLTIQCAADASDPTASSRTPDDVVLAIAKTTLRRLGDVSAPRQLSTGKFQMECRVEYGPVLGAYESDLRRAALQIAGPNARAEVFGCKRRELSPDDIAALKQKADTTEDLAERKQLERLLVKVEQTVSL